MHLLDSCGADLATLLADPAHWRDKQAKSAVAAAAKGLGMKRQDIYRRVGEFARLLTPVGLVATEGVAASGWLRVLHGEIEGFGQSTAALPGRGRRRSVRLSLPPPPRPQGPHICQAWSSACSTMRCSISAER